MELQPITDIVETERVRQLGINHGNQVTPGAKGARLFHSGFTRNLGDQVARNDLAELLENAELGFGWIDLVFFSSLLSGRAQTDNPAFPFLWDGSDFGLRNKTFEMDARFE